MSTVHTLTWNLVRVGWHNLAPTTWIVRLNLRAIDDTNVQELVSLETGAADGLCADINAEVIKKSLQA